MNRSQAQLSVELRILKIEPLILVRFSTESWDGDLFISRILYKNYQVYLTLIIFWAIKGFKTQDSPVVLNPITQDPSTQYDWLRKIIIDLEKKTTS